MKKYTDDKNRKGFADNQHDAKINCQFQKKYYKNVNAERKVCVWHGLSETFDRVPHSWKIRSSEVIRTNYTGWRVKAEDRQVWSRIVEQTKTHPGL